MYSQDRCPVNSLSVSTAATHPVQAESTESASIIVPMAKMVSVHSFRGGTGKSNTTANLATTIALRGHRVGIVDTDIQSPGIHVLFDLQEDAVEHSLNDFL